MSDITDKIRALLAKASGTDNPHESQAFYSKAHELMVKHNIEEAQLGPKDDFIRGEMTYGDDKWEASLQFASARLASASVVTNGKGACRFAGRTANVHMAEELFEHFRDQINKYWKMALPPGMSKQGRSTARRNFREAAAEVIRYRVECIISANARALIVSPLQLEQELRDQGIAEGRTRDLTIKHDSVMTGAGYVAGQLVEIGKEIK